MAPQPVHEPQRGCNEALVALVHQPEHNIADGRCRVCQPPAVVAVVAQHLAPLGGRRLQPGLRQLALIGDLKHAVKEDVHGQCDGNADEGDEELVRHIRVVGKSVADCEQNEREQSTPVDNGTEHAP